MRNLIVLTTVHASIRAHSLSFRPSRARFPICHLSTSLIRVSIPPQSLPFPADALSFIPKAYSRCVGHNTKRTSPGRSHQDSVILLIAVKSDYADSNNTAGNRSNFGENKERNPAFIYVAVEFLIGAEFIAAENEPGLQMMCPDWELLFREMRVWGWRDVQLFPMPGM